MRTRSPFYTTVYTNLFATLLTSNERFEGFAVEVFLEISLAELMMAVTQNSLSGFLFLNTYVASL